jgi:hypothetical protein
VTTDDAISIIAVAACIVALAACILAHYLAAQTRTSKAPDRRTSENSTASMQSAKSSLPTVAFGRPWLRAPRR